MPTASPDQICIFREVLQCPREFGMLYVTELCFDGALIGTTCNFVSGENGIVLRLSLAERYSAFSRGKLQSLELMHLVPEHFPGIQHTDSGAIPASFAEQLRRIRTSCVMGT